MLGRGPGLRRDAVIHGASLLDICPRVLHFLGLPVGEDMEGKVLLDIYDESAGRLPEVRRIPSWDLVEGDAGLHPPERQISPGESKEALDQLVARGCIEAPGADQALALEQTVRELGYNKAQSLLDGGRSGETAEILERLYSRWPDEHRFGIKLSTCYRNLKRTENLRRVVGEVRERRLSAAREATDLPDPPPRAREPGQGLLVQGCGVVLPRIGRAKRQLLDPVTGGLIRPR